MKRYFGKGTRARALVAAGLALGALAGASTPAGAADDAWRLRLGAGRITWHEDVDFRIAGQPAPGAGASLEDRTTLLAEVGYSFTPNWSANLTLGIPPTSDIRGKGDAAAFGKLGEVQYGPLAMTLQYQFDGAYGFRPYLGAGAVYFLVTDEKDGAVDGLKVDNAWGSLVQAGVEYAFTPRVGVFLDFKKLFLKTDAHGSLPALGGAPVKADVDLDPTVATLGVVFRF
jgi:outer membrane protein